MKENLRIIIQPKEQIKNKFRMLKLRIQKRSNSEFDPGRIKSMLSNDGGIFDQPAELVPFDESIEVGEATNKLEKKSRKLRIALILLGLVFLLYGAVLFICFFIQNYFVFDPQRSQALKTPDTNIFGPNHSENKDIQNDIPGWRVVKLETPDKITLHNYWILANEELKEKEGQVPDTIIYLHGKDGRIDRRLTMVSNLHMRLYCKIFMLSYRGYGKSSGSPSEAGFKMDAQVRKNFYRLIFTLIFFRLRWTGYWQIVLIRKRSESLYTDNLWVGL